MAYFPDMHKNSHFENSVHSIGRKILGDRGPGKIFQNIVNKGRKLQVIFSLNFLMFKEFFVSIPMKLKCVCVYVCVLYAL